MLHQKTMADYTDTQALAQFSNNLAYVPAVLAAMSRYRLSIHRRSLTSPSSFDNIFYNAFMESDSAPYAIVNPLTAAELGYVTQLATEYVATSNEFKTLSDGILHDSSIKRPIDKIEGFDLRYRETRIMFEEVYDRSFKTALISNHFAHFQRKVELLLKWCTPSQEQRDMLLEYLNQLSNNTNIAKTQSDPEGVPIPDMSCFSFWVAFEIRIRVFCLLIHAANALAFLKTPTTKMVALQKSIWSFAVPLLGSRPPKIQPMPQFGSLLRTGKTKSRSRTIRIIETMTSSLSSSAVTRTLTNPSQSTRHLELKKGNGKKRSLPSLPSLPTPQTQVYSSNESIPTQSMIGIEDDENAVYFGPAPPCVVSDNDNNQQHFDVDVEHLVPIECEEIVESANKRQKTHDDDEERDNNFKSISNNGEVALSNVSIVLDSNVPMDVDMHQQPQGSGITIAISETEEQMESTITNIKQLTERIELPSNTDEVSISKFISRVMQHVLNCQHNEQSMPAVIAKIQARTQVINFCYLTKERGSLLKDLRTFEERHKRAKMFVVSCQIHLINVIRMVTWMCRVIIQYDDNAAPSAKPMTENDIAWFCYRYLIDFGKKRKADIELQKLFTSWQIQIDRLADKLSINYIYLKDLALWLKLLGRVCDNCKFDDSVVSELLPPSKRKSISTQKHSSNLSNVARLWIRELESHSVSKFGIDFIFELVWPNQPPDCLESKRTRSGDFEELRALTLSVALEAANVINAPLDASQMTAGKEMAGRITFERETATVNLIWNYYRIYSHQYQGMVAPVNLYLPNLQIGERRITEDRHRRDQIRAELEFDESNASYDYYQNNITRIADSMFEELNQLLQQSTLEYALEQQMVDFPPINIVKENDDNKPDIYDLAEENPTGVSFQDYVSRVTPNN